MKLFDSTLTRLEHSLDVRLARHNVLASNLANVDTPGYSPKDVDFKAAMEAASGPSPEAASGVETPTLGLYTTSPGHIGGGGVNVGGTEVPLVTGGQEAPSIDGNRVDLDRTMAALAENSLQYGAGARAAGKKLAILRYVTSDGNG
jgi:flagellar basal-body rod protein FlgB